MAVLFTKGHTASRTFPAPFTGKTYAQSEADIISAVAACATRRGVAANSLTQEFLAISVARAVPIQRTKQFKVHENGT